MRRRSRLTQVAVAAVVVIVALAMVAVRPRSAQACSCGAFDPATAYGGADAVFTGTAVEVRNAPAGDPAEFERRYVFDVDQVFKGEVFDQQSVVSHVDDAACGLSWDQAGAIAIVFGFGSGESGGLSTMIPGEYAAFSCDTVALTAASIVPEYGESAWPTPGASPIGVEAPPPPEGGSVRFSWEWVAVAVLAAAGVVVGAWPRRGEAAP
jgi:hypothetical protein